MFTEQMKSVGPGKINITDAAASIDLQGEFFEFFYDRETGNVVETPTEEALYDMEPDEIPAAERELWDKVAADEDGKRFIKLPTQFEIHEFNIMRDFVASLTDEAKASVLSEQMRGGGAFNKFKNSVSRLGLENRWLEFKAKALKDVMREWCEEHKIEAIEE